MHVNKQLVNSEN